MEQITIKTERKTVKVQQVKEMLDDGAKLTAELFETGYYDENEPVKDYEAVVTMEFNEEKTTIRLNMLDMVKLVELYRGN